MKVDSYERNIDMRDSEREKDPYEQYRELGGIINKDDYENALARARDAVIASEKTPLQETELMAEAENMAKFAGIELQDAKDANDPRVKLYAILRVDSKPKKVKYHHSQMSDQRLFAEVLRMLGDTDSLKKLISAYPNISFK